jgi:hypothetical protein
VWCARDLGRESHSEAMKRDAVADSKTWAFRERALALEGRGTYR